jgi:tetratricopeptide (TPR) repeat protein
MNMRCITTLLLCTFLAGCGKPAPDSPKQRYVVAMARLAAADSDEAKFYALGGAAKECFAAGKIDDAQKYAEQLMALLPNFRQNRDYGGAMCDANLVLGRVAVRKGNLDDAKRYLIASAQSPVTPDLANNGPNMGLAKDLLEKGEKQAVLDYFELCRKLWTNGGPQLDRWSQQVRDGKIPDFGESLFN